MKALANGVGKRLLSLFLAVIAFFGVIGMNTPSRSTVFATGNLVQKYVLVTDGTTLAVGDKIVIAAKDFDVAMSTTQNTNNRGQTAIVKKDDVLEILPADAQELTLQVGAVEGTFALYTGSGYLYAPSSSSNHLKEQEKLSEKSSWTISIAEDGTATLLAQSVTRNFMQYYSEDELFSCYAANKPQKDIVLYREQSVEVDCAHESENITSEVTTEATCESDGVRTFTCVCGFSYTGDIPATGHAEVKDEGNSIASSCTTAGKDVFVCSTCEAKLREEELDKLPHEYVEGVCSCGALESEKLPDDIYVKVTKAPFDWSGQYLIVYEAEGLAFDGSLEKLDEANNTKEVTIAGNKISVPAGSAFFFTLSAVAGGYSIQSASGQYMGRTANSNGINESASTVYANTLALDESGSVVITATNEYTLRFNNGSSHMRFRYYNGGQQPVALYRLRSDPLAAIAETATEASFKLSYTEGVLEEAKLRFGVTFKEEVYETLVAENENVIFGVEIDSGTKVRDLSNESDPTWQPVADGNGNYCFAAVIGGLKDRWDKALEARVYVKIGATKYYMKAISHSVQSLAEAYIADDSVSKDEATLATLYTLAGRTQA